MKPTLSGFTWNAPPDYPNVRGQLTHIIVRFEDLGENETKVMLTHDGWGVGDEWDQVYGYFTEAWQNVVLMRLKQRFETGPVDWSDLDFAMKD